MSLPRILALLAALAVVLETSLMGRDNWRVERVLLVARMGSRLFLLGVLIYFFFVVPPLSSRSALVMVALATYFTAEAIHRIAARKLKKDIGTLFDVK